MADRQIRLLALDGGGVRGLSSLMVLRRLMATVDPDAESLPQPCDYFDMIGGTSTGGLIAVMLGRLRMSVDECIDAYASLSDKVFEKKAHRVNIRGQLQGRFDAAALESAIKQILRERGLRDDALLKDTDASCKVFVCAASKETSNLVCLSSYRSPSDDNSDLLASTTVWQACRATAAATTFFDPISIGPYGEEFVDGALVENNPVYTLWNQAQDVWGADQLQNRLQCLVSIGTGVSNLAPIHDDVLRIGATLKGLATETEKTAQRFHKDKATLANTGRYYRFNVDRGLEGVGLQESRKKNEIAAATRLYVQSQAASQQIKACAERLAGPKFSHSKRYYVVPLETVDTYTERAELSAELDQKLQIRHERANIPYAVALQGLGGAGKSQLALNYAEKHKDRYSCILWIDVADEEAARSSFRRCAAELGLPEEQAEKQGSVLTDGVVHAVLRWLRDRNDEWLVIVDNADDVTWGIQKIMPQGDQGSVIITSRDNRSPRLVPRGCESVYVDIMSPAEGAALLLQHMQLDAESAPQEVQHNCGLVAQKLGYLALAVDLAGAHIGNDSAPEQALVRYLADYDRHRDELLQMDGFQGLLPTQKTVWTVWDTTLEKITREDARLQPSARLQPALLLTFLAQFKAGIVQDEVFRLASLGMARVDSVMGDPAEGYDPDDVLLDELRAFLPLSQGEWDSFRYRQSRDVLVRYGLLQRVEGQWPGVVMHALVQWRAAQNEPDRPWRRWYTTALLAACWKMIEGDEQPDFRRHLPAHLPSVGEDDADEGKWTRQIFVLSVFGRLHFNEGLFEESEKMHARARELCMARLGPDHHDTLRSINHLASAIWRQGRWEEAKELHIEALESLKAVLGADHPDTLTNMSLLATTYRDGGQWDVAEKLDLEVIESRKAKLGLEHPDTMTSMNNLASTYWIQDRLEEAEKLNKVVLESRTAKLGPGDPDTLTSMHNLASIYSDQGRFEEAEKLNRVVLESRTAKLGPDHPDTLTTIGNLALVLKRLGQDAEACALLEVCAKGHQRIFGSSHPDTMWMLKTLEKWR